MTQSSTTARAESTRGDIVPNLPASENKLYYPGLDGLRAIAVLMVFFQHYIFPRMYLRWGWTGVEIFFVLSGFLITGILYDTRETLHRFRNFYVRRVLRIFPLYYAVLLVTLALTPIFHWIWHPAWFMWFLYLGNYSRVIWQHDWYVNGAIVDHLLAGAPGIWPTAAYFGHFWSLCIEEQFYLIWPLAVFLIKDRITLRNICFASFFVCLALRTICLFALPQDVVNTQIIERFTLLRVDSLLLGGFLALCIRGPENKLIRSLAKPAMAASVVAFIAMEVVYLVTTHQPYKFQTEGWLSTIGLSVVDIFAAALLLFTIKPGTFAFRMLQNSRLRWLGQISYGFYVLHDIPHPAYSHIGTKIAHGHNPNYVTAAIALVSTTLLSYLSYRFFESRFLRLKDRFTV